MTVPIESPYAIVINTICQLLTSYLVPFRSYRRLLFKFWTLCVFWISLFTWKSGSNKKGEKQTHKLN